MYPQSPSTVSEWFPIAATVAVVLFIAREVIEYFKHRRSDQRSLKAMKLVLARECELNLWPIRSLIAVLESVPDSHDPDPAKFVKVEERVYGPAVRIRDEDYESIRPIPKLHRDNISGMLLEAAVLEDELFKAVETAHDALGEAEHVRESLIRIHDAEREAEHELIREFAVYGAKELKKTEEALKVLYRYCTGKELVNHRLR